MAEAKITKRSDDYSRWYTDVIAAAELADYAPVKGCMIIRPNGYAIWEKMQQQLQQFPDSPGLRLQYAFTLDSVEKYKEALAQMDTLIKNDSAN